MCGIAGIFDRNNHVDTAAVGRMLDVQSHRGPDGSGTWADRGVVLGHRRLAIIDLTDDGAQPMAFGDERWVITYNGEIFNYVELRDELRAAGHAFRSQSDTEVVLAAYAEWGTECLHHFNGMFAFAIFDRRERTLFAARDRLGIKSLVYTWDGYRFAFASEAKALHAAGVAPGGMNPDAVYEYLARGYTSGGRSFHAGITMLEPGCALLINDAKPLRMWEWWTPDRSEDDGFGDRDAWAEHIATLLDDAVRLRLRSDVRVGAHLSGGLDSSAVVAAAARHGGSDVHTFTGAFTDDAASDERVYARAVAAQYGLTQHEVEIGVDELPRQFARILWHMDEPIAGPGVFPQMLVNDLAKSAGFTVALGGQGGDELFGGYLRHRALHWKLQLKHGSLRERSVAGFELARLARSEWRRVRRTSSRVGDARLSPEFLAQVDPALREEVRAHVLGYSSVRDLMWHDLRTYLPALLQVEDRTSMAASIESRTPMLDYRLVEASLRIPTKLLFEPGRPKPLLHRAVGSWLPEQVADRRDKKGFPTPLHHWKDRPELSLLVRDLTRAGQGAPRGWDFASVAPVFAADYLESAESFQASELWTVLTINGWLARLESGSYARPLYAAA